MKEIETSRRITDIILEYWAEIKHDELFPNEELLDISSLSHIWDNCFIVQTRDIISHGAYSYKYLGKNIIDAYGQDLTDLSIKNFVSPQAHHLQSIYDKILGTRQPLLDEGEFLNSKGKTVKYRQCLVPLGREGSSDIESILGGMRYKIE